MIAADQTQTSHVSVMREEVLKYLNPKDQGVYLDVTAGRAGHTRDILNAADCKVICLDRDPQAIAEIRSLELKNVHLFNLPFSRMDEAIESLGIEKVDGVLMDLGVSSPQLDQSERGFSFSHDGPLDMRFDPTQGQSAADIINTYSQEDLAHIFFTYGEERRSRAVARAIIAAREHRPITRTTELANIVCSVVKRSPKGGGKNPATRTFQGLRIYTNGELIELERGLQKVTKILAAGGVFVAISFHSLEDRLVKNFLKEPSGRNSVSRHTPLPEDMTVSTDPSRRKYYTKLTGRPVRPSPIECRSNTRARSGILRAAQRTDLAA